MIESAGAAIDGPEWLKRRRLAAARRLEEFSIPTEADEDWRYGRIDALDLREVELIAAAPRREPVARSVADGALLAEIGDVSALVRTSDGRVVATDNDSQLGKLGVRCASAANFAVEPEGIGSLIGAAPDYFTTLAEAFGADAVIVVVPEGVRVERPIAIVHDVTPQDRRMAAFPRLYVELGDGSEVTVVEHFRSGGGAPLVCPVSELRIGANAHLVYEAVQELDRSAWQIGYLYSSVERDATIRSFTAGLGGDYARLCTRSTLAGEHSEGQMLAAYFADGDQVQDMRTFQDHAAPYTRSNLIFKGAVDDAARSVYSGLIRIEKGARKADAAQTNRNLVLSELAHADSVPNLDIEENDVRCSHASAVGPIDREQRFYVESRGVRPDVAERLILLGFFEDLFTKTPDAGLARYLRSAVASRLNAAKPSALSGDAS
jgi:Fe-S cluster assembly protein SufD